MFQDLSTLLGVDYEVLVLVLIGTTERAVKVSLNRESAGKW